MFVFQQMRKKKWKPNPHNEPLTIGQKILRKFVWLVGIGQRIYHDKHVLVVFICWFGFFIHP